MVWLVGIPLGMIIFAVMLGVILAMRYFPDRSRMPTSPDVARLLNDIRSMSLFTPEQCDDTGIAIVAARYGFKVLDRDGTILRLRRNVWAKFRSLSSGGQFVGLVLFPLSLSFAAGLIIGLGWRRGYDEMIHLDTVARDVVNI